MPPITSSSRVRAVDKKSNVQKSFFRFLHITGRGAPRKDKAQHGVRTFADSLDRTGATDDRKARNSAASCLAAKYTSIPPRTVWLFVGTTEGRQEFILGQRWAVWTETGCVQNASSRRGRKGGFLQIKLSAYCTQHPSPCEETTPKQKKNAAMSCVPRNEKSPYVPRQTTLIAATATTDTTKATTKTITTVAVVNKSHKHKPDKSRNNHHNNSDNSSMKPSPQR